MILATLKLKSNKQRLERVIIVEQSRLSSEPIKTILEKVKLFNLKLIKIVQYRGHEVKKDKSLVYDAEKKVKILQCGENLFLFQIISKGCFLLVAVLFSFSLKS